MEPSIFQSAPPPELGRVLKERGITEAGARASQGCFGIVLGSIVAVGAWLATQFIPFGVRMDNTMGFTISTVIGLLLGGLVLLVMRRGKAEEVATFVCEHGIARMAAAQGVVRPLAVAPFAQVVDVRFEMVRHGKHGISLRKVWTFLGEGGRPLLVLQGEGTMDRWSPDPARATADDGGWDFGEAAIAQWQAWRRAPRR